MFVVFFPKENKEATLKGSDFNVPVAKVKVERQNSNGSSRTKSVSVAPGVLGQQDRSDQPTGNQNKAKTVWATLGSLSLIGLFIIFRVISRLPSFEEDERAKKARATDEFQKQLMMEMNIRHRGAMKDEEELRNKKQESEADVLDRIEKSFSGPGFGQRNEFGRFEFRPDHVYQYKITKGLSCGPHTYMTEGVSSIRWHSGNFLVNFDDEASKLDDSRNFGGILFCNYKGTTRYKNMVTAFESKPFLESAGDFVLLDRSSHPLLQTKQNQAFDNVFFEPVWRVCVDWIGNGNSNFHNRTFNVQIPMPNWVPDRDQDQFSVEDKGFPRTTKNETIQISADIFYTIANNNSNLVKVTKKINLKPTGKVAASMTGNFSVDYHFDKEKNCLTNAKVTGRGAFTDNQNNRRTFIVNGSWELKEIVSAKPIDDPASFLAKISGRKKMKGMETDAKLTFISEGLRDVSTMVFRPDGKLYVAAAGKGIGLYDPSSKKMIRNYENTKPDSYSLDHKLFISRDGKKLAQFAGSKKLVIWNAYSKLLAGSEELDQKEIGDVKSIDFSKDGKYMVTLNNAGKVIVWNLTTMKKSKEVSIGFGSYDKAQIQFSKDEQSAIVVDKRMMKRVPLKYVSIRTDSDKTQDFFNPEGILFSPNRRTAAKYDGREVLILSTNNFRLLRRLRMKVGVWIKKVAYSTDSQTLFCVLGDAVEIYHWRRGKKVGRIDLQGKRDVKSISVSPDGKQLILLLRGKDQPSACIVELN